MSSIAPAGESLLAKKGNSEKIWGAVSKTAHQMGNCPWDGMSEESLVPVRTVIQNLRKPLCLCPWC